MSIDIQTLGPVLEQLHGEPLRGLRIQATPLLGGLEAPAVIHVSAYFEDVQGSRRTSQLVAKQLEGAAAREAGIYEWLGAHAAGAGLAPRLLAVVRPAPEHLVLYVEFIERARDWPWRDVSAAAAVLERLAHFHQDARASKAPFPPWDYEAELRRSAEGTLEVLEQCRAVPALEPLARGIPWTRRIVLALPEVRRELMGFAPLGSSLIHGDVHPGNALLCRRRGREHPVLVDWGRARTGSPLEDVSSWLQSLGYWEPEARRRHDTLLAGYFSECGLDPRLTPELRGAYWLAGASNALSGALLYHLSVARSPDLSPARRHAAVHAARDWLRVMRRADAYWR